MNMKSMRTQQQIEKTLFSLLQKKPYIDISIAEITRKAEVSRTSFYRNYENKDAVLAQFLAKQYQKFIDDINSRQIKTLKDQLKTYLDFFKKNPQLMKSLLAAGLEGSLLNFQTRYLNKLLKIYHPNLHLEDYAIAYQSGGIYMLLVWWVKQDYQTDLAVLIDYAQKHIML
ncbi:TetR/AcrR family transcriptional regulator [Lactobacillus acidophilus]|uniref:TetR/AcrR family transcriptional regulator n=1 Tax=Lactobacillus acidophilus TaxID=1579 RepID=UPI0021A5B58E|nr:TetR/AcrR family transcriptional regulator [Lactobacillus acidophilus]MCT3602528.1 TetR/AcrR family transcriptional regulator [Lactobacillus acidophilus]MCT3623546.1 TetR/AcrR family transcriptional regulator [Lactobacillus acidophilus]